MLDEHRRGLASSKEDLLFGYSGFLDNLETDETRINSPDIASWEITTVIDRVYDYINERETISIDELSGRMGVARGQMEQIVDILERSQLIGIKYSLMPGEKAGIWVFNKNSEKEKKQLEAEDKAKKLKEILTLDIGRIEEALSSMEHYLTVWSIEMEETASSNGGLKHHITKTHSDAMEIQRNLEHAMLGVNKRVGSLNIRLTDMRNNISKPQETEAEQKTPILGRLLSIPTYDYLKWTGVFSKNETSLKSFEPVGRSVASSTPIRKGKYKLARILIDGTERTVALPPFKGRMVNGKKKSTLQNEAREDRRWGNGKKTVAKKKSRKAARKRS